MMGAVIDWVLLDHTAPGAVTVGDLVSADAGGMPAYRVVAVDDQRARLRDDSRAAEWVLPLARFQWKASRAV
jgi:hypothetical protein